MFKKIAPTLSISLLASLMLTATPTLKYLGLNLNLSQSVLATTTEEQTRIQVYEKASPSVVTIVYNKGNYTHFGSGFIISADGLVLTNAHVVKEASQTVTVILSDGREVIADIIGFENQGLDVAALKIRNQTNLPVLPLASFNSVKVGQSVYAIGSPLDPIKFQNTFTSGIVSKVDKQRGIIQHDAPINKGNSGGPLLNSNGEVIGINTWLYNPNENDATWVGIGMAISIEKTQSFLTALQQNDNSQVATNPSPNSNNTLEIMALPVNGQTITATLKAGDTTLPIGSYTHVYAFEGKKGQQISIEMNSQIIDPALLLYFPEQEILVEQNDDISVNNFNSRLVATLPYNGVYFVFANAFEKGETGEYQLKAVLR